MHTLTLNNGSARPAQSASGLYRRVSEILRRTHLARGLVGRAVATSSNTSSVTLRPRP